MRITLTNVLVDDQAKALAFYTEVLGFQKHHDVPVGEYSWLTVVSPEQPDGPELLLEPDAHPAAKTHRDALTADGIPSAQFTVDDVHAEHERLSAAGVEFTHAAHRPRHRCGGRLRRHLREPDPDRHPSSRTCLSPHEPLALHP